MSWEVLIMKSKTSFFNFPLFRSNFTRFWPLWTSFLAIQLIVYPLSAIGGPDRWWDGATAADVGESLMRDTFSGGTMIMFIAGAVFAMLLFSYLATARSASMYASLPMKRETVFTTNYLSGLIIFAVAMLITAVAVIIAEVSIGLLDMNYILLWLGVSSVQFLLFYSLAVFCGMLTGHIVVLPLLYAVLAFMCYFINMLVGSILQQFVYGYTYTKLIPDVLSPVIYIMSEFDTVGVLNADMTEVVKVGINHSGAVIGYVVAGIVLAVLSLLVYRRRHMETATDVVAVRALKPVFKYCMTFGCALVLGSFFFAIVFGGYMDDGLTAMVVLTLCMIAGGFVGYFISQMLMQKTFRVFRKGWGGFIVASMLIVLIMCSCEFDLFGYEVKVPDAEEVDSVQINGYGDWTLLEDEENIADVIELHKSIINNKDIYESAGGATLYLSLEYKLKDGGTFERDYGLYSDQRGTDEDLRTLDGVVNRQEAIDSRLETTNEITEDTVVYSNVEWRVPLVSGYEEYGFESKELTAEEAVKLYEAVMKDAVSGNIGRDNSVKSFLGESTNLDCDIYIEYLSGDEDNKSVAVLETSMETTQQVNSLHVEVIEEAENTLGYLKSIGIEPQSVANGKY